jgi:hypothetical protein
LRTEDAAEPESLDVGLEERLLSLAGERHREADARVAGAHVEDPDRHLLAADHDLRGRGGALARSGAPLRSETSAPCSQTKRSKTRRAMWRFPFGAFLSAASQPSITTR